MLVKFYFRLLVRHPLKILLFSLVVFLTCFVIAIASNRTIKFPDPQVGFETRGTEIARRSVAWMVLYEASSTKGSLTSNPRDVLEHQLKGTYDGVVNSVFATSKQNRHSSKKIYNATESTRWQTIDKNFGLSKTTKNYSNPIMTEGFLCGPPHEDYAKVVIASKNGVDLFQRDALMEICYLEAQLTKINFYQEFCSERFQRPPQCCRSWSLPNYIAQLQDKHSCESITEEEIHATKRLLAHCAQYYHSKQINFECTSKSKCKVPEECLKDDIYNILNYIIATSFVPGSLEYDNILDANLQETVMFLPLPVSESMVQYYNELQKTALKLDIIQLVALDFGIKNALFNERMLSDTLWLILGALLIFILMWVHTGSIFLTSITIIAVIFSLGAALFLYIYGFGLDFFPFLNLIVVVVVLGIGADDLFIFCKIWNSNGTKSVTEMVEKLNEAFTSISVSSCTTAVTFLTSIMCPITAMQCFGIFSTTVIVANWILVLTCIPACLVLQEIWKTNPLKIQIYISKKLRTVEKFAKKLKVKKMCWNQEHFVVNIVIKHRYIWMVIFTILIVASFVVIFVYPAAQYPAKQEFQLFHSDHLFEKYDLKYRNKFWFERLNQAEYKLPLRFVWGVLPADNGNFLDPYSKSTLEFDKTFDVASPESQVWLFNFCKLVRAQHFYQSTNGPLLENCFMESFVKWMKRRCYDVIYNVDRYPCCESSTFPYSRLVFKKCIISAMTDMYETPADYFRPGNTGPKFSKENLKKIKAIVIEYDSIYSYSTSYSYMHNYFREVETWFQKQLLNAPHGLQNGWFISEFQFYDLQRVLVTETILSITVSMLLAFLVLFVTTLNIIISFLTILAVSGSILVTLAVLVLLGWELNVLEATSILMGVGLAVDFSLHYAVHYSLSPNKACRLVSTTYAMKRVLEPASLAACTTFIAGAVMLPSLVLPYYFTGLFIILVVIVSSLFAVFYLGSLLSLLGPQNNCGKLNCVTFCCLHYKKKFVPQAQGQVALLNSDTVEQQSVPFKIRFTKGKSRNCQNLKDPAEVSTTSSAVSIAGID